MKPSIAVTMGFLLCAASVAQAGKNFHFNGLAEADYGTTNFNVIVAGEPYWSGDSGGDKHCTEPGIIFVTNSVPWAWQFRFGSSAGTYLNVIGPNGSMSGDLRPGYLKNTIGVLNLGAGANFSGGFSVGYEGYGVVTNNGKWTKSGELYLGWTATGHGVFVQNGTIVNSNPKEMHIGENGWGEMFVNAPFFWSWYAHGDSDIVIGQSQFDNRLVINEGGKLTASYIYCGGRLSGHAGRGELRLRGGIYNNDRDNGDKDDLFFLGACPNAATNGIDDASFGAIRGWGTFQGNDGSRVRERGVYIRMGHGEIVGDGEGDESHELVCDVNGAIYQVTNALPADVLTTSGWRAVNKGSVTLSRGGGYGWEKYAVSNCIGCCHSKLKPDLVNSVFLACKNLPGSVDKSLAAVVLAPDRSDAYTNALPRRVTNVLSVHRLGIFTSHNHQYAGKVTAGYFKADIRYDQTKIQREDTRIELLRYVATSGKWTRLVKIDANDRPADCVISMPEFVSGSATASELYTLGTFAIVETERTGLAVFVK